MKKIGIMGGTFNPIHNAHLMMAEAAYEQYGLDEVWFMPSKIPPHKDSREIVSEEHRSRMIQFAIDDYKHFLLSDMELKREGVTYTCETLQQCLNEFPEDHFYFILGGDSLCDFEKWCHPEKIARMCTILSVSRGSMGQPVPYHLRRYINGWHPDRKNFGIVLIRQILTALCKFLLSHTSTRY